MRDLLLGIDIGTSSCKVGVFTADGKELASDTQKNTIVYPGPGMAEHNPDEWWENVRKSLGIIFGTTDVSPREIAAVGVDGLSWAAIPITDSGKVLANTPLWMDTRSQDICRETVERIGEKRIFEVCGNLFQPTYTTPKVLWFERKHPELYRRTGCVLQSNGYLVYRLTGNVTQDLSQGYGWHCFDMRKGRWDMELARDLGIPAHFLPEICGCDEVVGKVTKEAAAFTGLQEGTPVVAGGLDACCCALGAGVLREGETQEQGGQAGGMSICLENYHADPRLIMSFHVVPDRWLLQGGTTGGGGVMRWFESEFGGEERLLEKSLGMNSLTQMNLAARDIPAGCEGLVFLPYMSGERTPVWDPDARGVFYGVDFTKRKAHFVRACMEGVAYSLRHNLETAESAGAEAKVLKSVGGSSNSTLWTQIKADVTGRRVEVPMSDGASIWGACLLAGKGTGMISSYEETTAKTAVCLRAHEPDPGKAKAYDEGYRTYLSIYRDLRDLMHRG